MRYSAIALLFALLASLCMRAQEPTSFHFTVADGLPSSEVYDVLQDDAGNMWFATDRDVVKYDGTEFKTYTSNDGLADNVNFVLGKDAHGNIWFGGFSNRVSWFDGQQFHAHPANAVLEDFPEFIYSTITPDAQDTVWLGFRRGVCETGLLGLAPDGGVKHWYQTPKNKRLITIRQFAHGRSAFSSTGKSDA